MLDKHESNFYNLDLTKISKIQIICLQKLRSTMTFDLLDNIELFVIERFTVAWAKLF